MSEHLGNKWKRSGNDIRTIDGTLIAIINDIVHHEDIIGANAELIATAPEMVEMLKECSSYFSGHVYKIDSPLYKLQAKLGNLLNEVGNETRGRY